MNKDSKKINEILSYVVEVLNHSNGQSTLTNIYDNVIKLAKDDGIDYLDYYKDRKSYEGQVRRAIYIHSADREIYQENRPNIFHRVSRGLWALDSNDHLTKKYSPLHSKSLNWFIQNKNKELSPSDFYGEFSFNNETTYLSTKARGIFKPKWLDEIVLSVRSIIDSPYNDQIKENSDGSWILEYHESDNEPWANESLKRNMIFNIPIGLFYQTQPKPNVKYKVYGLGMVEKYEDGYFFIKGFDEKQKYSPNINKEIESLIKKINKEEDESDEESPGTNLKDAREKTLRLILKRKGQPKFRAKLLDGYKRCCAVTKCSTIQVLEAAHIVPYLGEDSNHINNGILG